MIYMRRYLVMGGISLYACYCINDTRRVFHIRAHDLHLRVAKREDFRTNILCLKREGIWKIDKLFKIRIFYLYNGKVISGVILDNHAIVCFPLPINSKTNANSTSTIYHMVVRGKIPPLIYKKASATTYNFHIPTFIVVNFLIDVLISR